MNYVVKLIPGTDPTPVLNYVYVRKEDGSGDIGKELSVSDTGWPSSVEHIKVATVLLQTAVSTKNLGALKNHNWNDHIQNSTSDQGHLSHITEKIRKFNAQYDSGINYLASTDGTDVWVSVGSGAVYQLHRQIFPPLDSEQGDEIFVVNMDPVASAAYTTVTNLNVLTLDALGQGLNNTSFSFVVWGVVNESGEQSHLMLNLPIGSYSKTVPEDALTDALNKSVYDIPKEFQGTGFLIARFVFVISSGVWTLEFDEDLRGTIPNTTAGGGAGGGGGVTTFLGLTDTESSYAGSTNYVLQVNDGADGVDFTNDLDINSLITDAGSFNLSLNIPVYANVGAFPGGTEGDIVYNQDGDNIYRRAVSGWLAETYISNPGSNYVLTSDGSVNVAVGEADLTFDGTSLKLPNDKNIAFGSSSEFRIEYNSTTLSLDFIKD
jgi:hypothetical protein